MDVLSDDPVLGLADILLLNEADAGMSRSGNLCVAEELGRALGMNVVFGPAHIELTKGTDDDLLSADENGLGLQGNAVLSRHPVLEARVVPLPVCFDPFEFHEKRYGRRNCVWAKLDIRGRAIWAGAIHLEVRNTPRCRERQMRHLLGNLPGTSEDPHLIGGDLNSNGFARGTALRTLRAALQLVLVPPPTMMKRMLRPDRGPEPLFSAARAAGFAWEDLNSREESASAPIDALEDSARLPAPLVSFLRRRLAPYRGHLHFRLDWLMARGACAMRADQVRDQRTREPSRNPGCIRTLIAGAGRPSDHKPIFADLSFE